MAQEISTRVQLAAEQIGEDEALTSDLTDPAATALLEWLGEQIQAADAAPDDAAFQQQVKAIRAAAKTAARTAADEDVSAAQVVERAQAALAGSAQPQTAASSPAAPTIAEQPTSSAATAPTTAEQPASAQDNPATPAPEAPVDAPAQADPATPAADPSSVTDSPRAEAARQGSLWNSLRRRLRRWAHRKG